MPCPAREQVIQSLLVSTQAIRLGVSGGGFVAQVMHLPLLRELSDRFALTALADPSPRVRSGLVARYGFERSFASAEEMLAGCELDAVLVCSPNGTHAGAVLRALDARVHVLVEKPLCLTLADADRIEGAARAAHRVVQVGYMKRFDLAYEQLLADLSPDQRPHHVATLTYDPWLPASFAPRDALVADDVEPALAARLATDTSAQVAAATGREDPAAVHAFSELFLGALVHDVNLVHGALDRIGDPPEGAVEGAITADGAGATGSVALRDGRRWTLAWMLLRGLGDFRERIELLGGGGVQSLEFPAPYLRSAPTRYHRVLPGGDGWTGTESGSWQEPYLRQLLAFHASVVDGAPCRTPPEQARRDIALLTDLFRLASVATPAVAVA